VLVRHSRRRLPRRGTGIWQLEIIVRGRLREVPWGRGLNARATVDLYDSRYPPADLALKHHRSLSLLVRAKGQRLATGPRCSPLLKSFMFSIAGWYLRRCHCQRPTTLLTAYPCSDSTHPLCVVPQDPAVLSLARVLMTTAPYSNVSSEASLCPCVACQGLYLGPWARPINGERCALSRRSLPHPSSVCGPLQYS
jgi:hypothetical protein